MASTGKWFYVLGRLSKRMWVRTSLYCALAVAAALVGTFFKPSLPPGMAERFGADSVGNILTILASSMLVVATFSLNAMVSAFGMATTTVTPRAARLLIEDASAQAALATFIGAFLFAIVGLVALSTGLYGEAGRMVLFAATVLVIVLITVTLLRWIERLARLGRVGESIDMVEAATREAMQARASSPWLGGVPAGEPPADGIPVEAGTVGYVQHLDMRRLQEVAEDCGVQVHVASLPGALAVPGRPLAVVTGGLDEKSTARLREAFSVGDARSFEHALHGPAAAGAGRRDAKGAGRGDGCSNRAGRPVVRARQFPHRRRGRLLRRRLAAAPGRAVPLAQRCRLARLRRLPRGDGPSPPQEDPPGTGEGFRGRCRAADRARRRRQRGGSGGDARLLPAHLRRARIPRP